MTQEHSPTSIDQHLRLFAQRLNTVPELRPVVEYLNTHPIQGRKVYQSYLGLIKCLTNLNESELALIKNAHTQLIGEVGSASRISANDLLNSLRAKHIDLCLIMSNATAPSSAYYQPALDEVIARMEGGHAMRLSGKTPSDHDAESELVIWGHTVITGTDALLHFSIMHYLERYAAVALADQDVPFAQQKDFFINAMTDVVIINGLNCPNDPLFQLWVTPKARGGMGWITPDRLRSLSDQLNN